MVLRVSIAILVVLFASLPVNAKISQGECRDIDVSAKMGPIRNQDTADWCWSFVTADLVTAHQGFGPSRQVSAMDVALTTFTIPPEQLDAEHERLNKPDNHAYLFTLPVLMNQQNTRDGVDSKVLTKRGNRPNFAIFAYGAQGGACFESSLPTQAPAKLSMYSGFTDYYLRNVLRDSSQQFDEYDAAMYILKGGVACYTPQNPFTGMGGVSTARSIQAASNQESARQVKKLVDSNECKVRTPLKSMQGYFIPNSQNPEHQMINKIAGILRGFEAPVGLSFNGEALKQGRATTVDGPHVASLVGMRWDKDKKECQFKLRNSWGETCEPYHADFKSNCDKGYVWMAETDIQNLATYFFGIDPTDKKKSK